MDSSPPPSPPAIIQPAARDITDAYQRMGAVQTWLARQQAQLPAGIRALDPGLRQGLLDALDAFWQAPAEGTSIAPRLSVLADHLALVLREDALLRERDGTMDTTAAAIARRVAATRVSTGQSSLVLSELTVGGTAYAGALVAEDHDVPGVALLFTADHGWEVFARLSDVHAEIERRIRRHLAHNSDLPGMVRRPLLDALNTSFVGTRQVTSDIFHTMATRIATVQKDKVREAWMDHHAATHDPNRDQVLVDQVNDALQLVHHLDIEAILATREASLVEAIQAERLAQVPEHVRKDWEDAFENHLSVATQAREETGIAPFETLAGYASARLRNRLIALGVTTSPEDIMVRIDRSTDPTARVESLQSLFEGPSPARIRLIDLAFQNVASVDFTQLHAEDATGQPITALDDSSIRRLARALDLANSYTRYLTLHFRESDEARQRRDTAILEQQVTMQLEANDARLAYYLPHEPQSFRFDQNERGFRWIQAILDAPSPRNRRQVEGHDVVVRHVTYRGVALKDVLEIGVRSAGSVPTIILYTPGAPDGLTFREFDDRQEAGKRFLYHPAFRDYLLDRLPMAFTAMTPDGLGRRFDVDRREWIFGGSADAGYTPTGEPFGQQDIPGDFFDASYEAAIAQGFHDTTTYTRSAAQADWHFLLVRPQEIAWNNLISQAIRGAFTAPFHAARASWRLYDALKAGDHAQAFVDFTDAYTQALSLLPYYAIGRTTGAGVFMPRPGMPLLSRSGNKLVSGPVQAMVAPSLDASYIAKQVKKSGRPNRYGLYDIDGHAYLEHQGKLYGARYDSAFETVRLHRPGDLPSAIGPSVRKTMHDTWAPHRVGLLGGTGRGTRSSSLLSVTDRQAAILDDLNYAERILFRLRMDQELRARIPNDVVRQDMWREIENGVMLGRPARLSPEHAQAWIDAADAAVANVRRFRESAPASGSPMPLNMSVALPDTQVMPVIPAPQGYRVVAPEALPQSLYFYDVGPYAGSSFQRNMSRHHAGTTYSNMSATFRQQVLGENLRGVRLTTQPPGSPGIPQITGISRVHAAFTVQLDMRRIAARDMMGPRPRLQLLEVGDTGGQQFVLRSTSGLDIELQGGDFAPPVRSRQWPRAQP
ncbi:hypothetical protein KR767_08450 [Luteibacter anthropi]|uniref:dermonecrotic toxin domain-containing protein n=1 Tax=Luteibacter anthropi TaxID=564369 RepID=UPI002032F7E2|nr:DUF6543 domain-containing protein [Luteibacter anthropi]URX64060.1 hypothetical protein KR767_08450 [Luteibacter anthropi]